MSISPFHGGLVFRNESSADIFLYPQIVSDTKSAVERAVNKQASSTSSTGISLAGKDLNEFYNPNVSTLSLEERYELCMSVGEDVTLPAELKALLERKPLFNCYDGFEPSGRMHIA